MKNPLVHFEIHAADVERAANFYRAVFDWEIKKYDMPGMDYWGIMTCEKGAPNAINGGMLKRMGPNPGDGGPVMGYVCTMQVDNVDETKSKVLANGGIEALPKMSVPGMGWLFYFKDTEGNVVGAIQYDKSAP